MAQLKAGIEEPAEEQWSPTIAVGAPVMIPESYVADLQLRLGLYRRLSTFETDQRDRRLPGRAGRPLRAACRRRSISFSRSWRSRCCAAAPMSRRSMAGPKGIIVSFRDNSFANPTGLISYVTEQASFAKVRPDMKIVFIRDVETPDERIKASTTILRSLVRIAEKKAA